MFNFCQNGFNEDIVYGDLEVGLETGELETVRFPDKLTFYQLFSAYLPHPSTLIRRDLLKKLGGYDEKYPHIADWVFMSIAFGQCKCSAKHIPVVLSRHYLGGVSSQKKHQQKQYDDRLAFLKKEFPAFYDDYAELVSLKTIPRSKKNPSLLKESQGEYY